MSGAKLTKAKIDNLVLSHCVDQSGNPMYAKALIVPDDVPNINNHYYKLAYEARENLPSYEKGNNAILLPPPVPEHELDDDDNESILDDNSDDSYDSYDSYDDNESILDEEEEYLKPIPDYENKFKKKAKKEEEKKRIEAKKAEEKKRIEEQKSKGYIKQSRVHISSQPSSQPSQPSTQPSSQPQIENEQSKGNIKMEPLPSQPSSQPSQPSSQPQLEKQKKTINELAPVKPNLPLSNIPLKKLPVVGQSNEVVNDKAQPSKPSFPNPNPLKKQPPPIVPSYPLNKVKVSGNPKIKGGKRRKTIKKNKKQNQTKKQTKKQNKIKTKKHNPTKKQTKNKLKSHNNL
jgi:hypothetical protein